MIRFNQVSKKITSGQVLFNAVDFHLSKGSMVLFLGESGVGKTTLIKLMLGLDTFEQGHIEVDRTHIKSLKEPSLSFFRRQFGFVCQETQLLEQHNVFYNVALPLFISRYSEEEITLRVHAALEKVKLKEKASVMPSHLSLGEKKRVTIARAIVNKPKILLVDDLFAHLNKKEIDLIWSLFQTFNERGVTTVITANNCMHNNNPALMQTYLIEDKKIKSIT